MPEPVLPADEVVEPEVVRVAISICRPCLAGVGEECHTPDCALYMHRVDLPIYDGVYEVLPIDLGASESVVTGLVSSARSLLDCWDEFSDPTLFPTPGEGREQLFAVLSEWIETLRSATDLVIPDDLHAWCVTADEYETLRATVARLQTERDSLARRCAVRFEETQAALDVIRWLRAGRNPDLDAGLWWRNDLRVSWPMTDAHRAALRAAAAEPKEHGDG